jgi:hypothetical protein
MHVNDHLLTFKSQCRSNKSLNISILINSNPFPGDHLTTARILELKAEVAALFTDKVIDRVNSGITRTPKISDEVASRVIREEVGLCGRLL